MAKNVLRDAQIAEMVNFELSDDLDCSDTEFDLDKLMAHVDNDTIPLVFEDEYQELFQQNIINLDLETENEVRQLNGYL